MNQLRSFYMAASLKSITGAAQALMVTPPAITIQIKQLEEAIGIRLLVRDGNSIRLTEAGASVFKRAEKIFDGIREMEGFLDDMATGRSGELRIGCPEIPLKRLMPVIDAFKKTYPGIRIIIDQGLNADMVRSVEDHRNELAVIRHRPSTSRLKIKVIWADEVVLVRSPKSAHLSAPEISVTQLSEIPLILRRDGSAVREVVLEYLRRFKVTPLIAMESSSAGLLKEFVRQDNGVGFVERDAVVEELRNGTLQTIRILEGSPSIEFGIGYRNRRDLSAPAWAFLRLLDKSVPSLMALK
ncbi:MAG: LysR family transcriptional regulator [Syntrophorhabdaceae bacterium]|nr:LysR family transcriptional regulator [Syntrophorhabdaceae bacterium]